MDDAGGQVIKPGERRGGRKSGAPNKRTQQRAEAMQEAAQKIAAVHPDAFEGDSHALLASIYRKDPRASRSNYLCSAAKAPPLPTNDPGSQRQNLRRPWHQDARGVAC